MEQRIVIPAFREKVEIEYTSLSIDNEFIPVQSLSVGYTYKLGSNKVFVYGLPADVESHIPVRKVQI